MTTPSTRLSDAELLELAADGGGKPAWTMLVRRVRPRLTKWLQGDYGLREARAEEIAQDTLERIYRHAHRFDPSRDFAPWVTTIAGNLARNALRNRFRAADSLDVGTVSGGGNSKWLQNHSDPSRTPDPEKYLERREISEAVEDALQQLQPMHRTPMRLRLEGLAYKEIADETGIRLGTVKSRLSRARETLRERLRARGIDAGGD